MHSYSLAFSYSYHSTQKGMDISVQVRTIRIPARNVETGTQLW